MLAKALAHYFGAKLLLLDVTDFSLKVSFVLAMKHNCILCVLNFGGLFVLHRFRANMEVLEMNL